jgi:hypothetical protein
VQHDGCDWRCHVASPFAALSGHDFSASAARKFIRSAPTKRTLHELPAAGLFRHQMHGRMSDPQGAPGLPTHSIVHVTWPNLIFPNEDFVHQYCYVINSK